MFGEEDYTIKFEIKLAASKIISEVMGRNETMQKSLEEGITSAIEKFDFKSYCEDYTRKCIEDAIRGSIEWGEVRKIVKDKVDSIVSAYIERDLEKFKNDFTGK